MDSAEGSRLLVIDAGNSRCKVASGSSTESFPASSVTTLRHADISRNTLGGVPQKCVVSSVHREASSRIRAALEAEMPDGQLLFLTGENSPMPVDVENPDTLGADRIAAAIGAFARYQSRVIVVDAGTATTIDLVDERGVFRGGTIFPGFDLTLNALATGTDGLPTVDLDLSACPGLVGRNTRSAIQSGVFWSHVGGIRFLVERLQEEYGRSAVVFTGGSGEPILTAAELDDAVFLPNLVLEGLWEVARQPGA